MTPSTVLFGALPRMMRSIVESAVASQGDLRVAGDCSEGDLDEAVTQCGADVLIVEERADRSEAFYRRLLLRHPSLKVFMLTQDGRNVTLMGLRRARLANASPTTLVEAIRSELRRDAPPDDA